MAKDCANHILEIMILIGLAFLKQFVVEFQIKQISGKKKKSAFSILNPIHFYREKKFKNLRTFERIVERVVIVYSLTHEINTVKVNPLLQPRFVATSTSMISNPLNGLPRIIITDWQKMLRSQSIPNGNRQSFTFRDDRTHEVVEGIISRGACAKPSAVKVNEEWDSAVCVGIFCCVKTGRDIGFRENYNVFALDIRFGIERCRDVEAMSVWFLDRAIFVDFEEELEEDFDFFIVARCDCAQGN